MGRGVPIPTNPPVSATVPSSSPSAGCLPFWNGPKLMANSQASWLCACWEQGGFPSCFTSHATLEGTAKTMKHRSNDLDGCPSHESHIHHLPPRGEGVTHYGSTTVKPPSVSAVQQPKGSTRRLQLVAALVAVSWFGQSLCPTKCSGGLQSATSQSCLRSLATCSASCYPLQLSRSVHCTATACEFLELFQSSVPRALPLGAPGGQQQSLAECAVPSSRERGSFRARGAARMHLRCDLPLPLPFQPLLASVLHGAQRDSPGATAAPPPRSKPDCSSSRYTAVRSRSADESSLCEVQPSLNYCGLRLGGLHLGPRFRTARVGLRSEEVSKTCLVSESLKFQPPRCMAPDEQGAMLPFRLRTLSLELHEARTLLARGSRSGPSSHMVDSRGPSCLSCSVSGFETRMPKKPSPAPSTFISHLRKEPRTSRETCEESKLQLLEVAAASGPSSSAPPECLSSHGKPSRWEIWLPQPPGLLSTLPTPDRPACTKRRTALTRPDITAALLSKLPALTAPPTHTWMHSRTRGQGFVDKKGPAVELDFSHVPFPSLYWALLAPGPSLRVLFCETPPLASPGRSPPGATCLGPLCPPHCDGERLHLGGAPDHVPHCFLARSQKKAQGSVSECRCSQLSETRQSPSHHSPLCLHLAAQSPRPAEPLAGPLKIS